MSNFEHQGSSGSVSLTEMIRRFRENEPKSPRSRKKQERTSFWWRQRQCEGTKKKRSDAVELGVKAERSQGLLSAASSESDGSLRRECKELLQKLASEVSSKGNREREILDPLRHCCFPNQKPCSAPVVSITKRSECRSKIPQHAHQTQAESAKKTDEYVQVATCPDIISSSTQTKALVLTESGSAPQEPQMQETQTEGRTHLSNGTSCRVEEERSSSESAQASRTVDYRTRLSGNVHRKSQKQRIEEHSKQATELLDTEEQTIAHQRCTTVHVYCNEKPCPCPAPIRVGIGSNRSATMLGECETQLASLKTELKAFECIKSRALATFRAIKQETDLTIAAVQSEVQLAQKTMRVVSRRSF